MTSAWWTCRGISRFGRLSSATRPRERTELTKNDLRFYLDGTARGAFSYNAGTDRLSYTSGKLSLSRHTVKVVARDAAGNVAIQTWRFEVVS